jgi:thiaminase
MVSFIESLFIDQKELWLSASEKHPFLTGCANSTVSNEQFNTWLAQDYLYVNSFQPFLLGIIPISPSSDTEILASGKIALENELAWFKERAVERGVELSVNPLPTTTVYKDLMATLSKYDYSLQIIILYLIERVYQRAWAVVLGKWNHDVHTVPPHRIYTFI